MVCSARLAAVCACSWSRICAGASLVAICAAKVFLPAWRVFLIINFGKCYNNFIVMGVTCHEIKLDMS